MPGFITNDGSSMRPPRIKGPILAHLVVLLVLTTGYATADDAGGLTQHLDRHQPVLSNEADSEARSFTADVDLPQRGVVIRVAVDAGNTAAVAFDRETGLPFACMRDGLMVGLDPDQPGRLAVLDRGAPTVRVDTKPEGGVAVDVLFEQQDDSITRLDLGGLASMSLADHRGAQSIESGKNRVAVIQRERSLVLISWVSAGGAFHIRSIAIATEGGGGLAINAIDTRTASARVLTGITLKHFGGEAAVSRRIDPENPGAFLAVPEALADDPQLQESARAMAKVLRVGQSLHTKTAVDQSLRALSRLPAGVPDRRALELIDAVESAVIRDYVRQPVGRARVTETWAYDRADTLAHLLAERGLSSTYPAAQAMWHVALDQADLSVHVRTRMVALLGHLGIEPESQAIEAWRNRQNHDPDLAAAVAAALVRLGAAGHEAPKALCDALSDPALTVETKLDAAAALLSAQAPCEGITQATEWFAAAAERGKLHRVPARPALFLYAQTPEGAADLLDALEVTDDPAVMEAYIEAVANAMASMPPARRQEAVDALLRMARAEDLPTGVYLWLIRAGIQPYASAEDFDRFASQTLAQPDSPRARHMLAVLTEQKTAGRYVELINQHFEAMDTPAKTQAMTALMVESGEGTFKQNATQQLLLTGLGDEDDTVRWYAIKAVGIAAQRELLHEADPYLPTLAGMLDAPASDREAKALVITLHLLSEGGIELAGAPRDASGRFLVGDKANQWWARNLTSLIDEARRWSAQQID